MIAGHRLEIVSASDRQIVLKRLHDAGSIDKRTMREFDEACLAPAPVLSPDEIIFWL